jgi:uncharacterized protein YkwD
MRFLAALAVASAAVLVSSPVGAPSAPSAPTTVERRAALEAGVVREMNRVRAAKGLRLLRASPSLRSAARGHSQAMLAHGFFGHDSADGTAFSERIKRYYTNRGFATWSVGEALMAGQGRIVDAHAIVAAWLESPPHREIVLSPTWRDAGIGVLYAANAPREFGGAEAIVVTADFGLREGRAGTW